MKRQLHKHWMYSCLAALLLAVSAPQGALAQSKEKEQAARQAAQQHDARVLSVKEKKQGQKTVYDVKVLTKEGVVKNVSVDKKQKKKKK